jgi:opacity protein-like surface antigen
MRTLRGILLAALFCGAASAQYGEAGISGGWSIFTDNTLLEQPQIGAPPLIWEVDDGLRIGARIGLSYRTFFGHEISYAWQRSGLAITGQDADGASFREEFGGFSIHNFYYNFVAHATRNTALIRPFVTGGVGMSSFIPPGASALAGQGDTKFGFNYGAGLKFKVTDKYGVRFDVRNHVTGKPFSRFFPDVSGTFSNIESSVTFLLWL